MKNTLTIPAEKFPRPPDKRENARLGGFALCILRVRGITGACVQ
jgi:hypothetical protein